MVTQLYKNIKMLPNIVTTVVGNDSNKSLHFHCAIKRKEKVELSKNMPSIRTGVVATFVCLIVNKYF